MRRNARRPLRSRFGMALLAVLYLQACSSPLPLFDHDGDGVPASVDCDDNDSSIGALYLDGDGDGHGAGTADAGCASLSSPGFVTSHDDCDDGNAAIHAGGEELCDGLDNDCDTVTDDGAAGVYYADADKDGYGDSSVSTMACAAPAGYVPQGGDCDSDDATTYPGSAEQCDSTDHDCDGQVGGGQVLFYRDDDLDGYGSDKPNSGVMLSCEGGAHYARNNQDCNDEVEAIKPGALELCDGVDNDCDGYIDQGLSLSTFFPDSDGDGYGESGGEGSPEPVEACDAPASYTALEGDCDDSDPGVNPGTSESCNDKDDDCDGEVDEGLPTLTYYADTDEDHFGNAGAPQASCHGLEGFVADSRDCDDTRGDINPDAQELCDGEDNNCDGNPDEGLATATWCYDGDEDSYGDSEKTRAGCSAPSSYSALCGDCNDSNPAIHPGVAEVCDDKDNNCDHRIDEGLTETAYYVDDDGDSYGAADEMVIGCTAEDGYAARAGDCDDTREEVYPGAADAFLDDLDGNCNGMRDTVFRYAGRGTYSGDNSPATTAIMYIPSGIAWDAAGNLYLADRGNHRVRKINPAGLITTIAGNGKSGFSGDGGPATKALLASPMALALDGAGNLYIALQSGRVRKVDTNGMISTFAGNGSGGYQGDGVDATKTSLYDPAGIAVDVAGAVFIADTYNNRIRKVDGDGIISTVAGNGSPAHSGDGGQATEASLNHPWGIRVSGDGSLYIADSANQCIRLVAPDGTINTIAGTGSAGLGGENVPATQSALSSPLDLELDGKGGYYIADAQNNRIRYVDAGGMVHTVAGSANGGFAGDGKAATKALLNFPGNVALDSAGNLYIADQSNERIRKVDGTGIISTFAGSMEFGYAGDGGAGLAAALYNPMGLVFDSQGNLFIADSANGRVRKVTLTGLISTVAGNGVSACSSEDGQATASAFISPVSLAIDSSDYLYISDAYCNRVRRVSPGGAVTTYAGMGAATSGGDGGPATLASLNAPAGLAVDAQGNLYIAESGGNRIRRVDAGRNIYPYAGTGFADFSGDGGQATAATLNRPFGITFDYKGNLFIADTGNNRIRKVDPAGIITTAVGTGSGGFGGDGGPATKAYLSAASDLAVDASNNLFIADTNNNILRRVGTDGIIQTVVGDHTGGYFGDGGAATQASMGQLYGIAVYSGSLYFADTYGQAIRVAIP